MEQLANNNYRTSDTSLAAYLQTEGYPVIGRDNNAPRVVFILNIEEGNPKLQELVRLFHAGKARVEPSTFLRNYRILARQAREGIP